MSSPAPLSFETLDEFPLPELPKAADKNSRGRVLVVGGGAWGPGAPLLTALAVLRSGAGKVQVAAAERFAAALSIAIPEAAVITVPSTADGELAPEAAEILAGNAERADAVVVGPGILNEATGAGLAIRLAAAPGNAALLLDAGALTGLRLDCELGGKDGRFVITPHAGEMASLLKWNKGRVEADPLAAAREAANGLKAVVVMKGPRTFLVSPDGGAWLHEGGAVGLATSGSGDVLTGIIAGLMAQGAPPITAAAWGVCVHARAGQHLSDQVAHTGFLARELLDEIPRLLARGP